VPIYKSEVQSMAVAAKALGKGLLIIGARQNFIGELESVDDDCVVLKNACVAFQTGKLDEKKITNFQVPHTGRIIIRNERADAVMVGKDINMIVVK
jgi:hypothetical protein